MIFFYISLVTYFCFLILKGRKGIILLNSSKGSLKKYFQNIKINGKELFLTPELLALILVVIALNANEKTMGICFVIFYMLLFLYFLRKTKDKFKLKKGNISLIIILIIFFILINAIFFIHYMSIQDDFFIFNTMWIYYIISVIVGYLLYFIIGFGELINKLVKLISQKIHKLRELVIHKKHKL